MASTQDVTGGAPLTFTDSLGAQRSVPLSALRFNGSVIEVVPAWTSQFTATDLAILAELTKAGAAAGELVPPPVVPPVPAIVLTAATAGAEGDGITVKVTPDGGDLLSVKLTIQAKETDTYSGLAGADAAAHAIGVDTAGGAGGPPVGSGLVAVQSGSVGGSGLPKDNQTPTVKTATAVFAADGTTTLFKLVPRAGYSGPGIPVTVKLDPGGTTFTVQASHDSGAATGITVTGLGSLPPAVGFLVTAKAPPSGFALPADSTVTLSGGAPGVPATGTVYTS